MSRRRDQEDQAARIIQRGCHNWIWKPQLNDGTVGIAVRIRWKEIEKLDKEN